MPVSPDDFSAASSRPVARWRLGLAVATVLLVLSAAGAWHWLRPQRTKLEFLHSWTSLHAPLAQKILARFTSQHPRIELQTIAVHSQWSKNYLLESLHNGSLPDIFVLSSGFINELDPAQNLAALDQLAQADGVDLNALLPARELAGFRIDGHVRALPFTARSTAAMLVINLDLVERAGLATPALRIRNWAEFTAVSRQLVDALNPPGELHIVAWNPLLDRGVPALAALSYGDAAIMTPDGRTSLLDQPAMRPSWEAIEYYLHEVYNRHGGIKALIKWRHEHGGFASHTAQAPLAQGLAVFNFAGLWGIGAHQKANPAVRLAARPFPGLHGPVVLPAGNVACISINRHCPDPAAAWQLVRYLTLTAEGNGELNLAAGTLCALPALNDLAAYRRKYGPVWEDVAPISTDVPSGRLLFDADSIERLTLDYLRLSAADTPLAETIRQVHRNYQAVLDQRRHHKP